MKILAFVDMHANKNALAHVVERAKKEDIDVVVSAGDHTIFGQGQDEILEKLGKTGKPVLLIHGNHEEASDLKNACSKHKNCFFIHGGGFRIGSFLFIGWGGGGFSFKDARLEERMDKIKSLIEKDDRVILVTHAPAFHTKVDNIGHEHAGNKSIRKLIEAVKPIVAISGHLHETAGHMDKIGRTLLINPGAKGKVLIV